MHPGQAGADIDYLVLSGHKLYAPGSRGALIGRLATLSGCRCVTDVGGGITEYVTIDDYALKDKVTAREEAGTPNIPGTIAMGLVAETLLTIGMDVVAEAEERLTRALLDRLGRIDEVMVYGTADLRAAPRAGVVSFNVEGIDHGLVAAYLDDEHNIAVRNGCFCAQPYVRELLALHCDIAARYNRAMADGDRRDMPGMVRASLGIYSRPDDIAALGDALERLVRDRERVLASYQADRDGTWRRRDGAEAPSTFAIGDAVRRWAEA